MSSEIRTEEPGRLRSASRELSKFIEANRNRLSLIELAPGILWVIFLLGGSFLILLWFSVSNEAPPHGEFTFTTQNYREFITTELYITILFDSLLNAFKATLLTIIISYPAAYYLAFSQGKRRNFYLILLILPFWINYVVRTFAWQLILGRRGLVNFAFHSTLPIWTQPKDLLFTNFAIVIGLSNVLLPFLILPLYSSLRIVDRDEIEAAKNLGANKLQAFFEVTLPQSLPGLAAGTMIVFILSFGSLIIPLLLGGSNNTMIANTITSMFRVIDDWALGSAMSVVFAVITLLIVYIFNRTIGLENLYGSSGGDDT